MRTKMMTAKNVIGTQKQLVHAIAIMAMLCLIFGGVLAMTDSVSAETEDDYYSEYGYENYDDEYAGGDLDGDGILDEEDPDMDGDNILNEDDPDMDGNGIPDDEEGTGEDDEEGSTDDEEEGTSDDEEEGTSDDDEEGTPADDEEGTPEEGEEAEEPADDPEEEIGEEPVEEPVELPIVEDPDPEYPPQADPDPAEPKEGGDNNNGNNNENGNNNSNNINITNNPSYSQNVNVHNDNWVTTVCKKFYRDTDPVKYDSEYGKCSSSYDGTPKTGDNSIIPFAAIALMLIASAIAIIVKVRNGRSEEC